MFNVIDSRIKMILGVNTKEVDLYKNIYTK